MTFSSSANPSANKASIVWFRNDLRLADNPALVAATKSGLSVRCIYIHDTVSEGMRQPGGAQKWMLHQCLEALSSSLAEHGATLTILAGPAVDVIHDLANSGIMGELHWNRRYDAPGIDADKQIKEHLQKLDIPVHSHLGNLMHEPFRVQTKTGGHYRVYTPFWRAFSAGPEPREPLPVPEFGATSGVLSGHHELSELGLLPTQPDWAGGLRENWNAGERAARERFDQFLNNGLAGYKEGRNFPALDHTSRMSPYLRFGVVSPYQLWHWAKANPGNAPADDLETFFKELVWREFSYHLLFHYPDLSWQNYSEKFNSFPWAETSKDLEAWQNGQTGIPIVDAGMRQLWQTGWMHNRVRMIVGSFLVKHMLVHWHQGEEWFWDTLVDGDPASNSASWQWVAGSGADAAPYFRVFNPLLQSRKFDPDGDYIRKYIPELAKLPSKAIHSPWEAGPAELEMAGITLGNTYPQPILDLGAGRDRALEAFKTLKEVS